MGRLVDLSNTLRNTNLCKKDRMPYKAQYSDTKQGVSIRCLWISRRRPIPEYQEGKDKYRDGDRPAYLEHTHCQRKKLNRQLNSQMVIYGYPNVDCTVCLSSENLCLSTTDDASSRCRMGEARAVDKV